MLKVLIIFKLQCYRIWSTMSKEITIVGTHMSLTSWRSFARWTDLYVILLTCLSSIPHDFKCRQIHWLSRVITCQFKFKRWPIFAMTVWWLSVHHNVWNLTNSMHFMELWLLQSERWPDCVWFRMHCRCFFTKPCSAMSMQGWYAFACQCEYAMTKYQSFRQ